jgi:hypothetical protein
MFSSNWAIAVMKSWMCWSKFCKGKHANDDGFVQCNIVLHFRPSLGDEDDSPSSVPLSEFVWSGHHKTQITLPPKSSQQVSLGACFSRPGIYDLSSLSLLVTPTSQPDGVPAVVEVAQQNSMPSVIEISTWYDCDSCVICVSIAFFTLKPSFLSIIKAVHVGLSLTCGSSDFCVHCLSKDFHSAFRCGETESAQGM